MGHLWFCGLMPANSKTVRRSRQFPRCAPAIRGLHPFEFIPLQLVLGILSLFRNWSADCPPRVSVQKTHGPGAPGDEALQEPWPSREAGIFVETRNPGRVRGLADAQRNGTGRGHRRRTECSASQRRSMTSAASSRFMSFFQIKQFLLRRRIALSAECKLINRYAGGLVDEIRFVANQEVMCPHLP